MGINRWVMYSLVGGVLALVGCNNQGLSPGDADPLGTAGGLEFKTVGRWVSLGEIVHPSAPPTVLASDELRNPVVAFSKAIPQTSNHTAHVLSWKDRQWSQLGETFSGFYPSLGLDNRKNIYACVLGSTTPSLVSGPFVKRWNGSSWESVGGDISVEVGHGGLQNLGPCKIVLENKNPVVAWTFNQGDVAAVSQAARWDSKQAKWVGLGEQVGTEKGELAALALDEKDRLYIATYYRIGPDPQAATRVWRWNGSSWILLGSPMLDTRDPTIAARDNTVYLMVGAKGQDTFKLLRWRNGGWQELASLSGLADWVSPALDFTPSGKPVVAYVEKQLNPGGYRIRAKYLAGKNWKDLGVVSEVSASQLIQQLIQPDLSLDWYQRPIVVWAQATGGSTLHSIVQVKRFSESLH